MPKRIAIRGDATNMGGVVITASGTSFCGASGVALLGDLASCPKCKSTGKIINGAHDFVIDGKPIAYDGCIIACKCSPIGCHKIIATKSDIFVDVPSSYGAVTATTLANRSPSQTNAINNTSSIQKINAMQSSVIAQQDDTAPEDKRDLIRIDARRLLKCADELCEKHLYHEDIKQGFKKEVNNFANDVVYQVDTGAITYEQGAEKIKEEEDSLLDQSMQWVLRGLGILGGASLMAAGAAMCTTGVGCLIGTYVAAHGLNSIQEGITGEDGFLKSVYQDTAKQLGMSESFGSLVYHSIDLAISVRGKLKYVPEINKAFKINEFNPYNKSKTFKLWRYGRDDLVRTITQMSNWGLKTEILNDVITISSLIKDIKNVVLIDEKTKDIALSISEPEKIENVGELIETCEYVMLITFEDNPAHTGYYRCTKPSGEVYKFYEDSPQNE